MTRTPEVVLCHAVRTAIGTYGGTLKDTPAPALGAAAIREAVKRAGLPGDQVDAVIMGNVIQAGVSRRWRARAVRPATATASRSTRPSPPSR